MNILFIAAEVAPFVSVGGLSQVMFFLSRALKGHGHDIRICTPKYGLMDNYISPNKFQKRKKSLGQVTVSTTHSWSNQTEKKKSKEITLKISSFSLTRQDALIYFFENEEYYGMRDNVFGYSDDHTRFALLSKATLEFLLQSKKKKGWLPDIIHCHDWHSAYAISFARNDQRYKEALKKIPIVLTVHNFKYQGNGDFRYITQKEKSKDIGPFLPLDDVKLKKQNALRRGLKYADAVNTVSPTHALEVLTPEYAEGLENTLQNIRNKISGILNGLDVKEFNPQTDPIIKRRFNKNNFNKARLANKKDLQKEFLLPIDDTKPLLAYSGRLAKQKGLGLIFEVLPHLFEEIKDLQLVVLGSGDDEMRQKLFEFKHKYPDRVGLHLLPNFNLPRKIFAGADMLLMPSLFEPGGIVALEALRYGAIPIVRRTGGLNDIIEDFNPETSRGNGFSFDHIDPWSLYAIIIEALTIYKQKSLWKNLVKNALTCDFSWEHVSQEYVSWYKNSAKKRRRAIKKMDHTAYK